MKEADKRASVLAISYLWLILYSTYSISGDCNVGWFLNNFVWEKEFLLRAIKKLEEFNYLKLNNELLTLTDDGKKFVEDIVDKRHRSKFHLE